MEYLENGSLIHGLHSMSADGFVQEFCVNGNRKNYERAICNIFDFAKSNGANRIIIGGSFITNKENPNDLDCLIVFNSERNIPSFVDCAQIDNIEYDIIYTSEQMPNTVDTFIKLMSTDRYGRDEKGVVEVLLCNSQNPWKIRFTPNDEDLEVISRIYAERNIIERNKRRGLLVVVHGICTNAAWLSNLVPAVNSQGWIVAPFIYNNPPTLLFNSNEREKVVEQFREWMYTLKSKYQPNSISVVCHSFGTYIMTKYIEGFKSEQFLPIEIESLVLTGSIINPQYDWEINVPCKIGRVLNIQTDGDDAVKYMPNTNWKRLVGMDSLFGQGAIHGIQNISSNVENRKIEILTHSNIFKDDFIETILLPYLNVNNGIGYKESIRLILKKD